MPSVVPFWRSSNDQAAIYCGDAREVLRTLPEKSVHCVVTSPPYWQIRGFGVAPTIKYAARGLPSSGGRGSAAPSPCSILISHLDTRA